MAYQTYFGVQRTALLYHVIQFAGHASQRGQNIRFDLVFRTRFQVGVRKFSKFPNPRRIDRNDTVSVIIVEAINKHCHFKTAHNIVKPTQQAVVPAGVMRASRDEWPKKVISILKFT